MPGDEVTRLTSAQGLPFYERAGRVVCLGGELRGSLTAIGPYPLRAETSQSLSQQTMRIVKVFWSLDASLAYARHFPAINWLNSYSPIPTA